MSRRKPQAGYPARADLTSLGFRLQSKTGGAVSNLGTVQGIYESFGKGDVPAILDVLADDVEWEAWENNSAVNAGVPWMVPRHGKADAVHFFETAGQMEII
jgi:uncharacterized protein